MRVLHRLLASLRPQRIVVASNHARTLDLIQVMCEQNLWGPPAGGRRRLPRLEESAPPPLRPRELASDHTKVEESRLSTSRHAAPRRPGRDLARSPKSTPSISPELLHRISLKESPPADARQGPRRPRRAFQRAAAGWARRLLPVDLPPLLQGERPRPPPRAPPRSRLRAPPHRLAAPASTWWARRASSSSTRAGTRRSTSRCWGACGGRAPRRSAWSRTASS